MPAEQSRPMISLRTASSQLSGELSGGLSSKIAPGLRITVLIGPESDGPANKIAVKMARHMLASELDTLEMVHCVEDEFFGAMAEEKILEPYKDPAFEHCTTYTSPAHNAQSLTTTTQPI
eukprot:gene25972-11657_t